MRRKRFTFKNRSRAWARWDTYRAALDWLMLSGDRPGDFYWTPSECYAELRRRRLVDEFERVTPQGKGLRGRLRTANGIPA